MNDLRCVSSFYDICLYENIKMALEIILFKNFEINKDLRRYINFIFFGKFERENDIEINIDQNKEFIFVKDTKYAIKMYIFYKLEIREFIQIPTDVKRITGINEVLNSIINLSKEINDFLAYFTLMLNDCDRETMIRFIKKYNYIPVSHSFFENDEFIFY